MKITWNENTGGLLVILGLIFCILVIHSISDSKVAETAHGQVVRIIDGDTLEIDSSKIRLYGIDAPELGQQCTDSSVTFDCGMASKEALSKFILDSKIKCEDQGSDRWGRIIGICYVAGQDLSELMVSSGWAIAYRKYSKAYIPDEEFARKNELGIWSGKFVSPSDWRASK